MVINKVYIVLQIYRYFENEKLRGCYKHWRHTVLTTMFMKCLLNNKKNRNQSEHEALSYDLLYLYYNIN